MDIEIYHNPRCRKSREALQLLESKGIEPTVVEYLKELPSRKELEMTLAKLNMKPSQLLRKGELIFKEKFRGMNFNEDEWLDILMEYPKLIERPIVIKGNKAVVGRPIENVEELIGPLDSARDK
ncbi:MAG: arsenate reductase (glutaredoxin) [Flavobacteriales bacterium]|nr:arsenate reductase (glutaredoxin) [Flavobacteriales bacterium]